MNYLKHFIQNEYAAKRYSLCVCQKSKTTDKNPNVLSSIFSEYYLTL